MNKEHIAILLISISCIGLGYIIGLIHGSYQQMDYTSKEMYKVAKSNLTLYRDSNYNLYSITLYEPFDYTKKIKGINQSNTS